MDKMIAMLLPGILLKVGEVPKADKILFLSFVDALLLAYLQDRRSDFDELMSKLSYPDDWKSKLTEALWK